MDISKLIAEEVASHRAHNRKCGVSAALAKMESKDAAVLRKAFGDKDITNTVFASVIKKATGVPIKPNTVSRHRTGRCSCDD